MLRRPTNSTLFPYTTLFRSELTSVTRNWKLVPFPVVSIIPFGPTCAAAWSTASSIVMPAMFAPRSEEHTSELQSQSNLVCRLLLEKKKKMTAAEKLQNSIYH